MMLQGQVEALLLKCQNDGDFQLKLFEIYEKLFTATPAKEAGPVQTKLSMTGKPKIDKSDGGAFFENLDIDQFWSALKV